MVVAVVAAAAVAVGGVFLFGGSGGKPAAAASPLASPSVSPSASPSVSPSAASTPAAVVKPAHHCTYLSTSPAARKVSPPPARPDYKARYTATIHTNRGDIVIRLLNSRATCTVNSFVHLALQKFFDNTHCHRLTTTNQLYVLQCGDPTGTGTGGPGYGFGNENLAGARYTTGVVAMAHSSQPNSNGSQFFLVYRDSTLPADYTPFGTIVSGLNIIQKVAKAGSDNSIAQGDGHPKEKVEIKSVTIKTT